MVENIRLDLFKRRPDGCVRETVDFERQAFRRRVHLAHEQCHALMYTGMIAQIIVNIDTKCTDIGELAPVDRITGTLAQFLVPFFDFLGLLRQIICKPVHRSKSVSLFIC